MRRESDKNEDCIQTHGLHCAAFYSVTCYYRYPEHYAAYQNKHMNDHDLIHFKYEENERKK
jgi:hypothetical protein